ncbi:TIGR03013 family XrtA/PEP-CTERM system glycosyltransferase [Deferrisoma camini]|uniref:TIGR03013 family XrtA/PEP-CTERM system glycosyltransferase n=1 Tax=Deferrisoma camini TaxID=1035120 RepID=UPI0004A48D7A|nr:TIGR03013 family XrtA/PEP-CTERM system glycosyltransferase [Deferrisoma camini]
MRRALTVRHVTLFVVEDALILGAVLAAMGLRFGGDVRFLLGDPLEWMRIGLVVLVTQVCFYYHDLYELKVLNSRRELMIRLLQALGVASILLAFAYYVYPDLILGRGIFVLFVAIVIGVVVLWRLGYTAVLSTRGLSVGILLVGAGDLARKVYRETLARKTLGFHVVGCLAAEPDGADDCQGLPPVLGGYEDLLEVAARPDVDRVVVAIAERRGKFPVRGLLELRLSGKPVLDGAAFYEELTGKMLVEHLRPSQLIFSEGFSKHPVTLAIKRFVDFAASLLGLVVSAPIWAVIPLAIKLDSPGPVFFRQERVGEKGRRFEVLKFRSMRSDAEKHTGPVWARDNDDRVTRVGRFIRKTRIDEIPQLVNVLKGEMSFVGPRPERPFFVEQLAREIPYYVQRHTVKPGVTGLAQVKYSYGSTKEDALEKLRYDLYYIKRMGFWMDVSIIFETVKVVLFGKGAK